MSSVGSHSALDDVAARARSLLEADEPRAALALASVSLRAGDHAGLRLVRARALLVFRAVHEAERDIARAIRLQPDAADAYLLLCELALVRGDLWGAEVFLRDARRLAPDAMRTAELTRVVRGWRKASEAARDALETPRLAA